VSRMGAVIGGAPRSRGVNPERLAMVREPESDVESVDAVAWAARGTALLAAATRCLRAHALHRSSADSTAPMMGLTNARRSYESRRR
jgi:hypothetical protein